MKLFAEDSSLFARVADVTGTHEKLKVDIQKMTELAYQWKIIFNLDLQNKLVEVIFSVKTDKPVRQTCC